MRGRCFLLNFQTAGEKERGKNGEYFIQLLAMALFLLTLLGTMPPGLLAQTAATGALTGTVTDPTGAVVPEVEITVTNEATGVARTVTSGADGTYVVPLLPPGSYRIEAKRSGFKTATVAGIAIRVTETTVLNFSLEVGPLAERVIVEAAPEVLQTESTTLGRVVDETLVRNLPLVARNYTQIVVLSPGISANVTDASALGRGTGGESQGDFTAHGGFLRDNNFQMNGVGINDLQASGGFSGGVAIPNPDTVQEFKVQTGQYDASYGRNAGANVNLVTKGGSNDFHGTLFHFFRNEKLNANDFFFNSTGQEKGILRQNQFGGTLGGPVKKDKLLFFASYQGTRQDNGVGGGSTASINSPPFTDDRSAAALGAMFAGRRGLFQEAFAPLCLLFLGTPCGPAIAADGSNISPQALALLNLRLPDGSFVIPIPQTVDPSRPFDIRGFSTFSVPATFEEDQFMINLDYLHSVKSRFAGRFFFADSSQAVPLPEGQLSAPSVPGFPLVTDNGFRNFSLSHSYAFSAKVFNEARFGFHRIFSGGVQEEAFQWSDVGVNAPLPDANAFPALSVLGSLALGGNGQSVTFAQNHFTFEDSLTYVRGRHTFRLGGGLTRSQLNLPSFDFFGGLLFLSWPDFLLGLPGCSPCSILGLLGPGGTNTAFGNIFLSVDIPAEFGRAFRVWEANAYIQDDIRLTPRLTLNLGVRYDRVGHLGDDLGRNGGFDLRLANSNPPAAGTLEGFVVSSNFQGTIPAGVSQLDTRFGIDGKGQNNWGPRVGFAWQLPGTDRLVLRGGYGIYYTRATGQPLIQMLTGPPFGLVRILSGVDAGGFSFANPFLPNVTFPIFPPYSPTTNLSFAVIAPDFRPPITQHYSLNLQTEFARDFLLEVGYVGTRGTHLIAGRLKNQAGLASPASPIRGETTNTVANIPLRAPLLGFTSGFGLRYTESSANLWYNGLEVSVTKRMSKGSQFLAAYTFSRSLSDSGENPFAAGGAPSGNQIDRRANYGRNLFNREHRFVLSYLYELPRPTRFNTFLNKLLGGWAVAGVTTFQSGQNLTLTGTNGLNVFGITGDRVQLAPGCTNADLVNSGSVDDNLTNYFNASCISGSIGAPIWLVIGDDGLGTAFGNSGVGIVRGPDQRNFDIAIIKRTWVTETSHLEFRGELFNAFNTPQFSNPSTNFSSSSFGRITSTSVAPRIIQLALKFTF